MFWTFSNVSHLLFYECVLGYYIDYTKTNSLPRVRGNKSDYDSEF